MVSEVRVVGILLDLGVSLWSVCGENRGVDVFVSCWLITQLSVAGIAYNRSSSDCFP